MNLKNRPYLEVEVSRNGKVGHRENPFKMKFPFPCYYSIDGKHKRLGLVNRNEDVYHLIDMAVQKKTRTDVGMDDNLEDLIINYNIETVKVKIIVFE